MYAINKNIAEYSESLKITVLLEYFQDDQQNTVMYNFDGADFLNYVKTELGKVDPTFGSVLFNMKNYRPPPLLIFETDSKQKEVFGALLLYHIRNSQITNPPNMTDSVGYFNRALNILKEEDKLPLNQDSKFTNDEISIIQAPVVPSEGFSLWSFVFYKNLAESSPETRGRFIIRSAYNSGDLEVELEYTANLNQKLKVVATIFVIVKMLLDSGDSIRLNGLIYDVVNEFVRDNSNSNNIVFDDYESFHITTSQTVHTILEYKNLFENIRKEFNYQVDD